MSRYIHFHRHKYHPRREVFKGEETSVQVGSKHARVCPKCGHSQFKVIESRLSWLLGQRFKCGKCGFIFKQPFTEMEHQEAREFERTRR